MADGAVTPLSDVLGASLTQTVGGVPQLGSNPSVALSLASMGATIPQSQAVQQAIEANALNQAYGTITPLFGSAGTVATNQAIANAGISPALSPPPPPGPVDTSQPAPHHNPGFLGSLGHLGSAALKELNKPLQLVQHEYRYLHDVEARHGIAAAVAEGVGIAAGAVAGGVLAGPEGIGLGAEAATGIEGQLAFRDSWQRTANGNAYRDPHTAQAVSLGRDVSNLLGIKPKEGPGIHLGWSNLLSAGIDGAFDIVADPLQLAGRLKGAAVAAQGIQGMDVPLLGKQLADVPGFGKEPILGRYFSGTGAVTPARVDEALAKYPSVRRAFQDLADTNSAGQIVAKYGMAISPAAVALQNAHTVEDVASVFRNALEFRELAVPMDTLPRLSLTRSIYRPAFEAATGVPVVGKVTRALERLPVAYDDLAKQFSNKEFSLGSDYSAEGIYRVLRYGETHDVATAVANEFLNNPDPGARLGIYRNSIAGMVVSYAKMNPDQLNEEDVRKMMGVIDESIGYGGPGSKAVYGIDRAGNNLSDLPSYDGQGTTAGAITLNQTGKMRFPSMDDIKQAASMIDGSRNLYGRADSWVYGNVMSRWKSWVTATGGFAGRIALSEMIPNTLRLGAVRMARAAVESAGADLNYAGTYDSEEIGRVAGALYKVFGKDLTEVPEDQMNIATKLILRHDGQIPAPAVSAEHGISSVENLPFEQRMAAVRKMGLTVPAGMKLGDTFGMLQPDDANAIYHWTGWLRELGGDPPSQAAAQAYADARDAGASARIAARRGSLAARDKLQELADTQPRLFANYYRGTMSTTPGVDPLDDWGRTVMENVRGATTGANGTEHTQLLRRIAEGQVHEGTEVGTPFMTTNITQDDVRNIPQTARPTLIKGREFMPDPRNGVDRMASLLHQRVIGPLMNFFSRQNIYAAEVAQQYEPYKALVAAGSMSDSEAMDLAETKAIQKMTTFIHNPLERTQFSDAVRNWVPFYFAQEQAYKRFGRLLMENPGAFRQYQLMLTTLHNVVTQVSDQKGNNWAVYPGTGMLTDGALRLANTVGLKTVAAVPVQFAGSTSSLSTIFPFAEGVRPQNGPLVAIAAHTLDMLDPHIQPALTKMLGDQTVNTALWQQIIPNATVRDLVMATPIGEQTRGFQSAEMQVLQNMALDQDKAMVKWRQSTQYKTFVAGGGDENDPNAPGRPNLLPSPEALQADPKQAQQLMNRVRNQARIMYVMKSIFANIPLMPATAEPEIGNLGLPAELQADITKAGSVSQGITDFLKKNPDATAMTVFQSTTPGADVPASQQAMDWINTHSGFVNGSPLIASFFMPQETNPKYSPAIYQEEVAIGLRQHKTPAQFLNDLYIAAGNHQYFDVDLPSHQAALAALGAGTIVNGVYQTTPGAGAGAAAEYNNWDAYVQQLEKSNPIWGAWFTSGDRKQVAMQAIQDIGRAMDAKQLPPGPQTNAIVGLMADYEAHMANMPAGSVNNQFLTSAARAENNNWDSYLKMEAKANPMLAPIINKVFRQVIY